VTISGVTNDGCDVCDVYNGTFTMELVVSYPGGCNYQVVNTSGPNPENCAVAEFDPDVDFYANRCMFACNDDGDAAFDLVLSGTGGSVFSLAKYLGTVNCDGDTTLTYDNESSGYCTGYPGTVTIIPGPCI
jgi:hypothetical protein